MRRYLPSPAMAVACLALLVSLGGTGYAVTVLPKNSVGTAQLKNDAVIGAKVKDGSLRSADFATGQLPRAWAVVDPFGNLLRDSNVTSTVRLTKGAYCVLLDGLDAEPVVRQLGAVVTLHNTNGYASVRPGNCTVGSTSGITVDVYSSSGFQTDAGFTIIVP